MSRQCKKTNKVKYRDELDAKIALARLVWRDKGQTRVYFCPYCKNWHLTHKKVRGGKNQA